MPITGPDPSRCFPNAFCVSGSEGTTVGKTAMPTTLLKVTLKTEAQGIIRKRVLAYDLVQLNLNLGCCMS